MSYPQQNQKISDDAKPRLRIFLSYGHDQNEALVKLIKADLEKRGHDVWIDKSEIKFGDDWRRAITDGILGRRVLAFLSKHAMRDPGVCRDEIAIALGVNNGNIQTILVESETEVKPPANISHVQWLDMHDWQEQRAKGTEAWNTWYQDKLSEIVRVVESEKSQRFAGEIEELQEKLKPIPSDTRANALLKKGVVGREWLFKAVEAWRTDPARRDQRIFWLTGAPGVGKSAFAAKLAFILRSDVVVAAQFVEWDKPTYRDAKRIIRNLAFQLATRLPDYRKFLCKLPELAELDNKEPSELFNYLLADPLRTVIDGGRERQVIVIDALDEAGDAQSNPFVQMLEKHAPNLPEWLSFVVTSRPESAVKASFQGLNPYIFNAHSEANLDDLRTYLMRPEHGISNRPDADRQRLIGQILDKSEGVFLYVEYFCDEVKRGHISLDKPADFPRGLGGIYLQWFQRQFPDVEKFKKEVRPALRPILAAIEPLPLPVLQKITGWGEEDANDFTVTLGSLFPLNEDTQTIKPYHKSLTDWLTDKTKACNYFVSVSDGQRALAEEGWRQFKDGAGGAEAMDDYFLRWLPTHLHVLKNDANDTRVVELLKDFRFLMERTKRRMLERLLEDYRDLPARLGAQIDIEAAFFREKAHILRRESPNLPTHKILLQLATEHADDSPLTLGAERWLEENRCDWFWLRRVPRLPHVQKNPCIMALEGHTDSVNGALELHDGRILSWAGDHTLRLWDSQTGKPLAVWKMERNIGLIHHAVELRGGRILTWSDDGFCQLWDGQTGKPLAVGGRLDTNVLELCDGRILSWSLMGEALRLWDGQTNTERVVPISYINDMQELGDERFLSWAWWGFDKTLWLRDGPWNKQTDFQRTEPLKFSKISGTHDTLKLRDGRILSWSGGKWSGGDTLRLRDGQADTKPLAVEEGQPHTVRDVLKLRDGRVLTWSDRSSDTTLRLWDGQTGNPLAVLKGHSSSINGVLELRDGRILSWSGWPENTLRLWDGQTGKPLAVLEGHTCWVNGALELRDGRILSWSYDTDRTLRLWDGQSGKLLMVLAGYSHITAKELRAGRILLWNSRTLWLWDGQSGKPLKLRKGHTGRINDMLELRDERILSIENGKTLQIWDGQTGQPLAVLEGHYNQTKGALELRSGRILSWSHLDKKLLLWDGQTGKPLAVLKGHTSHVKRALELRDGRVLSWAWDNMLLWDCQTWKCLETVPEKEVAQLHPEWLWEQTKTETPQVVVNDLFGTSSSRHAQLRLKTLSADLAVWEADSEVEARCLMPDGTLVVTQQNGQICFLKLYHGKRCVSLEEAEKLVGSSKANS